MNNLIAKSDVFIGGRWYKAGQRVPGDVVGFNYEKAARKGQIESEDGEPITNPVSVSQAAEAPAPEPSAQDMRVQELERELLGYRSRFDGLDVAGLQRGLKAADLKVGSLNEQVAVLTSQLDEAKRQAQQSEADAQALATYREVVGELLPPTELQPRAHKSLLANGYYTVTLVQQASDEELKALSDVADATVDTLRRLYPVKA